MLSSFFSSGLHGLLKRVMLADIDLAFYSLCKVFLALAIEIAMTDIFQIRQAG